MENTLTNKNKLDKERKDLFFQIENGVLRSFRIQGAAILCIKTKDLNQLYEYDPNTTTEISHGPE